ncbi:hypothetical protein F511_26852 [Dorcoceras hygrometricum]|uniref:Uncharacterized protein n=1 Tax=Dorcoceras hygrometricum TaxID=472368 RepID=A0A2Z7AR15_9LAMI|nr:hypothetical protein F511_26852 [Dorcoceras hygrometricum]
MGSGGKHIDVGPRGHKRTKYEHDEHIGRDRQEENPGCDTQTDHRGPDKIAFTIAQDEQEEPIGGCPEGETFEIADWVDNADGTEKEESTYQHEKVSGPNDMAIVVRPAPEKSAQPSLTITGSGIFTPIEIREINWVTYFLPKIYPASKGKETLVVLTKSTLIEEHCQLVLNSAWHDHLAKGHEHRAHDAHLDVQQHSLSGQQEQQGSGANLTQIEDPSVNIEDTVNNPGPTPISEEHNTDHQGPNPSNLQMVSYTTDSEENTHISFLEDSDSSIPVHNKYLYPVPSKVLLLTPSSKKWTKLWLQLLELKSMDSKLEELLLAQQFMKNHSGIYHRTIYEKVDTLAANVTTSQTALETSLIRQIAGQQCQLTTDLDMVKLQLAELVEHLKKIGDVKKGKETRSEKSQAGQGKNQLRAFRYASLGQTSKDKNPMKKSSSILWNQIGRQAKLKAT